MNTDDAWVIVYSGTIIEADLLRSVLESEGIESLLENEVMGTIASPYIAAGGVGAVRVVVAGGDREHAKRIADDFCNQAADGTDPEVL